MIPQYYKTYKIKYIDRTKKPVIETAWCSYNDDGDISWTLTKDDTTIIPDGLYG